MWMTSWWVVYSKPIFETDHVLEQLAMTYANFPLYKSQWYKNKVNYVGLLIGEDNMKSQLSHIQAIQSIKTPLNLLDLHSFLGICN